MIQAGTLSLPARQAVRLLPREAEEPGKKGRLVVVDDDRRCPAGLISEFFEHDVRTVPAASRTSFDLDQRRCLRRTMFLLETRCVAQHLRGLRGSETSCQSRMAERILARHRLEEGAWQRGSTIP